MILAGTSPVSMLDGHRIRTLFYWKNAAHRAVGLQHMMSLTWNNDRGKWQWTYRYECDRCPPEQPEHGRYRDDLDA